MKSVKSFYKFKYLLLHLISFFFKAQNNRGHRCLMYHSVFKKKQLIDDIHTISFEKFKRQINYLRNFKIIPINKIKDKNNDFSITFDDGYKDTLKVAYPFLKKYKIPFAIFIITKNLKKKSTLYLNKKDIKKLSLDNNVTIGSHSVNHLDLTKLNNQEIFLELKESKKKLEKLIKKKVFDLSFPFGKFNKNIIKIAKKVGYRNFYNSIPLTNKKKSSIINRQTIIYYDNLYFFKNKINGQFDAIYYLKKNLYNFFN